MEDKKGYAVLDKRNNAIYFQGTEWECMEFLLKTYPKGSEAHENVVVGKNWANEQIVSFMKE